jgi:arginine exporter protein ArgO
MKNNLSTTDIMKIGGAVISIFLSVQVLKEYFSDNKKQIEEIDYEEVR